jgi:hypothetical protein
MERISCHHHNVRVIAASQAAFMIPYTAGIGGYRGSSTERLSDGEPGPGECRNAVREQTMRLVHRDSCIAAADQCHTSSAHHGHEREHVVGVTPLSRREWRAIGMRAQRKRDEQARGCQLVNEFLLRIQASRRNECSVLNRVDPRSYGVSDADDTMCVCGN